MPTPTPTTRAGDNPSAAWHTILHAARSDVDQARIDAALNLAAATIHAATGAEPSTGGGPPVRDVLSSGSTFARVALMWHQVLTDTDAFTRSRAGHPTGCRFDPDTTRTWLTGPSPHGHDTVADWLGLDADFDIYGFDKWEKITNLVREAQQAGILAVADHSVDVLHLAGEHGYVDRHRVTLTTPLHAVLCSDDLDTEDLIGDRHGVDAAIQVLGQVAAAVDGLLHQRAALADIAWPTPTQQPHMLATSPLLSSKAFRPLALTADPPTPAPATPATSPASSSRKHR